MLVLVEGWVCSVAWVSFGGSVGEELQPVANSVCVIITIMVMVFTEEMLMRMIYMRVLLGIQCPGHPDHQQQGREDMLLSNQHVDGCHTFSSVLPSSGIRCWVWIGETAFCELLWRMLSCFPKGLYPVLGTCSGLCWQSCAGKKVFSWLWKHVGECPHPQVAVLVIKHLISQVV